MANKKLSEALADRRYMGIMFKLGGMVEIEDDPTILLDAIRTLESELAFQTANAADAHRSRADQFRRAADALESLAGLLESYDLVLRMVPPTTADVIRGAFVTEVERARTLVSGG